jgi:hypothetical protein
MEISVSAKFLKEIMKWFVEEIVMKFIDQYLSRSLKKKT